MQITVFKNILTANQVKLLPLVKEFSRDYYLVGGTAIALFLGHRRSREFGNLEKIKDNYEKIVISMDRFFPAERNGIIHRYVIDFLLE